MAAKPVDMNVVFDLDPLEAENEALRKANEFLRTENESLRGENVSLRERVRTLERDLYSTSHPCLHILNLTHPVGTPWDDESTLAVRPLEQRIM
jgi:hypothetical protein